jgi:ferredoxin
VETDKCTACGNCVQACPRDLIELHPVSYEAFVFCKSQDPGAIARKVCKKACIACKLCVKAAAADENPEAVTMQGNLAVVNTENYAAKVEYGAKCPTDAYSSRANIVNYEPFVKEKATAGAGEHAGDAADTGDGGA